MSGIRRLDGDPIEAAAKRLAVGEIGAIYTGRMEYGPRALGARTILANPSRRDTHDLLNQRLNRTELMIRAALDRLLNGRTAIVIAHRLSTIQHADRILVFHKSRLREQGTHQELLAQRGIYYRLYQLQYKDQELRVAVPPESIRDALAGSGAGAPRPADD